MKRFFLFLFLFINLLLIYQIIFSQNNIFLYLKIKKDFNKLSQQVDLFNKKNILLSQEIEKLKSDKKYLEKVIKEKLNYIKPGEVLYLFKD